MPYPPVRIAHPDAIMAAKLVEGYSGRHSELTTVLQYANHSLQCKGKNHELSILLRGIFYVETLHMELLGECIAALGGEIPYNLTAEPNAECWYATLVDYESQPAAILQADITGEKQAADFYIKTAAECKQPELAQLLLRLAEDEKLHYRLFTGAYQRYYKQR